MINFPDEAERTEKNIPLDSTTARIVSELSGSMLPGLKAALSPSIEAAVADKLNRIPELIEAAEGRMDKIDETSKALQYAIASLRLELNGKLESLEKNAVAIKRAAEESGHEVKALRAERDEHNKNTKRSIRFSTARHKNPSGLRMICHAVKQPSETANRAEHDDEAVKALKDELTRLTYFTENRFNDWEGLLRAEGRAQTRELETLATEVTELLRDTKSELKQELVNIVHTALTARDAAFIKELKAAAEEEAKRSKRLEKLFIALGCVCILTIIVTALF